MQPSTLTAAMLGNRETIRQNTSRSEEIVKIELSKVLVRENFNVREEYGDIEGLAHSILENGQILPGRVDSLADGTFLLVDGHRRFQAMQHLASLGHEPMFKAIVNTNKTTEEERLFQMFTTQDNKQLAPHEVAEIISRLINLGHSQVSIAKKIGKTPAYVSQMLAFSKECPAVKELVKNGDISPTAVRILQKKIPAQEERKEAIEKMLAEKKTDDTTKEKTITVRSINGSKERAKENTSEKIADLSEKILEMFNITEIDQLIKLQLLIGEYF